MWWKKALNVQAPYRWNLRRQRLGRTLDVGCGIGRNLETLDPGSVGVDHNEHSVAVAREAGVTALTVAEWEQSPLRVPESFDGILLAHVIEHMTEAERVPCCATTCPTCDRGARCSSCARRSAATPATRRTCGSRPATTWRSLAREVGLQPEPWFSFPFPRWAGKPFLYNEFCLLATKPT